VDRVQSNRGSSRPRPTREARPRTQERAPNALAAFILWALVAGGIYWLMGDNGRELRALLWDLARQLQ
jgi:hypothetical protein